MIVFFWAGHRLPSDGSGWITDELLWGSGLIYACCCCLRLARFNLRDRKLLTKLPEPPEPPGSPPVHNLFQRKLYFEGLPAPVAACYLLVPVMIDSITNESWFHFLKFGFNRERLFLVMLFVAFAMVSSVPTLSSKMLKQNPTDTHLRSRSTFSQAVKILFTSVALVEFLNHPIEMLLVMNLSHMLSVPIGLVLYYKWGQ